MNTGTSLAPRPHVLRHARRAGALFTALTGLAALGAWDAAGAVVLADPVIGAAIQLAGSASSGQSTVAQMGGVLTSSLFTGQQVLNYLPSGTLASSGYAQGGTTAWLTPAPSVSAYGSLKAMPLSNGFGPLQGGASAWPNGAANYGYYEASAGSHLTYQFLIGGPFGTVNYAVAAQIQAVVSTQPFVSSAPYHTYAGASAYMRVHGLNAYSSYAVADDLQVDNNLVGTHLSRSWIDTNGTSHFTDTDNGGSGTYTETGIYQFHTNTVYVVDIGVSCDVIGQFGPQYGAAGSCTAFSDPVFTIDPATPNAAAYQLQFSSGVGNAPAVPEPSPALLFAAGLATLGAVRRVGLRGPGAYRKRLC
jgi:hypothetical protein